jgi:DNA-binding response OmpR family regulator
LSGRVLLAEPSSAVARTLQGYLGAAGFEHALAQRPEDAVALLATGGMDVVCVSAVAPGWDGEQVCRELKRQKLPAPILLMYPPEVADADERGLRVGADLSLSGPLKAATFLSTLRLLVRFKGALGQGQVGEELQPSMAGPEFEKLVSIDARRARRYGYPLTLLAVALDAREEDRPASQVLDSLRTEARAQVSRSVRDTDFYTELADDRFLLTLPYTVAEGALLVAERVRTRLFGLGGAFTTASAGLVSFDPKVATPDPARSLIESALTTLREAQAGGGDRTNRGVMR